MAIGDNFVASLKAIHPRKLLEAVASHKQPKGCVIWSIGNELKPMDLYCYLGARFGAPNGAQNFLRNNSSDNLIHWEWTLLSEQGWVSFQGMNFRTEVLLLGPHPIGEGDKERLVAQVADDFANQRAGMSSIRNALERWIEFANPYFRIRRAVDLLLKELEGLSLDPQRQAIADFHRHTDPASYKQEWDGIGERYSRGLGLCFGIRSMVPVMAEAFVNLLLYALMKEDIRNDKRLRENAFRQHIDIRIKSLHLTCDGFAQAVDYADDACKRYHAIVNARNDLLHGNVSIEKLKFNEVYFLGKVPVFQEYRSMWDRTVGVDARTVGLDKVLDEVSVVQRFIEFVLSCLQPDVRPQIEMMLRKRDLGHNEKTGGWGILFPDWLVDMKLGDEMQTPPTISGSEENANGNN